MGSGDLHQQRPEAACLFGPFARTSALIVSVCSLDGCGRILWSGRRPAMEGVAGGHRSAGHGQARIRTSYSHFVFLWHPVFEKPDDSHKCEERQ